MDPIEMLMADHREVEGLFSEFERLAETAPEAAMELATQIVTLLEVHTRLEEDLFYPAYRQVAESPRQVLESIEEHHVAKGLMRELKALTQDDERFLPKMAVLREIVDYHVLEEEQELMPRAQRAMRPQQLQELAMQLLDARERLQRQALNLNVTMVREFPVEQPRE